MTITELKHKREDLRSQMQALVSGAELQKRELNEDEQSKFEEIKDQIDAIAQEIEDLVDELAERSKTIKPMTQIRKMNNDNSIIRQINSGKTEIRMNLFEQRDVQVATGLGVEQVGTDILQVSDPLTNALILAKLGGRIHTGLQGNQQIPIYSGTSVDAIGQTDCVTDTQGVWTEKIYSPMRVTATIPVSKQWLIQEGAGAEQMLKRDIIRQLSAKIEGVLLGNGAATATQPQGIGNLITPIAVTDFPGIVALQTAVQLANYNELKYGLNPAANGKLFTMPKDTGSGLFVRDMNGINGYPVEVSGNVFANGGIVGSWEDYDLFIWGNGVDLTIDPYSKANCGQVVITATMYYNGGPRDNNAFVTFTV